MTAKLVWATPHAQDVLVHMARVSNPKSQEEGADPIRLIKYLIRHKHWSPFEMVHACLEVNTTRDIGRQLLRHRSFSFQEFSQRYADTAELATFDFGNGDRSPPRLQDPKNRQASIATDDLRLAEGWYDAREQVVKAVAVAYNWALEHGIAKEVARQVLPEGLTPTRLYMVGSFRSWIHYFNVRLAPETQKEHRDLANQMFSELYPVAPQVFYAAQID